MPPTAAASRPPRRTQRARRETTRRKLLEATVSALVAVGYARTTTTEICARAGVSQGALFKHFATKAELLAAAAEHLFRGLVEGYRHDFAAVPRDAERVAHAVELLWEVFRGPALQAAFELYVAARTDSELRATLRPVTHQHGANLRSTARELFPATAARRAEALDRCLELLLSAMQGAALARHVSPGDPAHTRMLVDLEALVRDAVDPADLQEG